MTYGEVERLAITQHGHGVTVAMNHRQYRVLTEALQAYADEFSFHDDGKVAQDMARDIEERGFIIG